jgi:uncharacterized protein YndB with AHSA1/START domain
VVPLAYGGPESPAVDAEDVMRWWGPHGFTCPLARIDFREGGTSLVWLRAPEYGDHHSTWRYVKIAPLRRIAYTHNLTDKDGRRIDPTSIGMPPDFPQDPRNTLAFKALADRRTEITVTEYAWPVGQMMELSRIGREQCLEKMAALFAAASAAGSGRRLGAGARGGFDPGVPQGHDPVEDEAVGARIHRIPPEVAQPLELVADLGRVPQDAGLDESLHNCQGMRVHVVREFAPTRRNGRWSPEHVRLMLARDGVVKG